MTGLCQLRIVERPQRENARRRAPALPPLARTPKGRRAPALPPLARTPKGRRANAHRPFQHHVDPVSDLPALGPSLEEVRAYSCDFNCIVREPLRIGYNLPFAEKVGPFITRKSWRKRLRNAAPTTYIRSSIRIYLKPPNPNRGFTTLL